MGQQRPQGTGVSVFTLLGKQSNCFYLSFYVYLVWRVNRLRSKLRTTRPQCLCFPVLCPTPAAPGPARYSERRGPGYGAGLQAWLLSYSFQEPGPNYFASLKLSCPVCKTGAWLPWPDGSVGWSIVVPYTKRLRVVFLVRAHT